MRVNVCLPNGIVNGILSQDEERDRKISHVNQTKWKNSRNTKLPSTLKRKIGLKVCFRLFFKSKTISFTIMYIN